MVPLAGAPGSGGRADQQCSRGPEKGGVFNSTDGSSLAEREHFSRAPRDGWTEGATGKRATSRTFFWVTNKSEKETNEIEQFRHFLIFNFCFLGFPIPTLS